MEKVKQFLNMETRIQVTGNREVLVECCKKILEYNDIMVKVRTRDMIIQVWGSELTVNDFNSKGIFICGNIQSIELSETGESYA